MSSTGGTGRPSCLKALKMPGAMSDTWNTPLTSPGWALRNVRVWVLAIVGSNLPTTVPTTLTLHAFITALPPWRMPVSIDRPGMPSTTSTLPLPFMAVSRPRAPKYPSWIGLGCRLTAFLSVDWPRRLMTGMLALAAWSITALSAVGDPSVEMMKSTCCWTSERICWIWVATSFGVGGVVTTIELTLPGFCLAYCLRPSRTSWAFRLPSLLDRPIFHGGPCVGLKLAHGLLYTVPGYPPRAAFAAPVSVAATPSGSLGSWVGTGGTQAGTDPALAAALELVVAAALLVPVAA